MAADRDRGFALRPSTPDGNHDKWTKFTDPLFCDEGTTTTPEGFRETTTPQGLWQTTPPEELRQTSRSPRLSEFSFGLSPIATSRAVSPATHLETEEELPHDQFIETEEEVSLSQDLFIETQGTPTPNEGFSEAFQTDEVLPKSTNIIVELPKSTLIHPRSAYTGFVPGAAHIDEPDAVAALLRAIGNDTSEDFIEIGLTEFSIYLDSVIYPIELRPLNQLTTRAAGDNFFFDGILHYGKEEYFVKKIPFRELPIGNHCDILEHSVNDQIWIRFLYNRKKEIYYKLEKPSAEYERYWTPFLWVADLAKHVVDYCLHVQQMKLKLRLNDFGSNFAAFVNDKHSQSDVFQKWYAMHGSADFRSAIATHIDFIWKEALGLPHPDRTIATWHEFWREVKGNYYTPIKTLSKNRKYAGSIPKTIVTPYVFNLFSHMGFDTIIESATASPDVQAEHIRQSRSTSGNKSVMRKGKNETRKRQDFASRIKTGDVISTPPDDHGTGTKWKRETSKHHGNDYVWYGMVQKIHVSEDGHRSFDVIWMYQSRDTPCALMKYPWPNELFLSDTCTCETDRIDEEDVLANHRVAWYGEPSSANELFVRQTYLAAERCWIALSDDHMLCNHQKKGKHRSSQTRYSPGDTVLVKLPESARLEPFVIERLYKEGGKRWTRLRKLPRRHEIDHTDTFPANELVYSDQLVEVDSKRIVRHCLIRVFSPHDQIPSPYDRGGMGGAFYITTQQLGGDSGAITALDDEDPLPFRQGFLPAIAMTTHKLCGLDLFCGGGNFGRGIEDGGAVEMKWANDINPNAIHSYMANCAPDTCKPYLGSIDDLFSRALEGDADVPRPGDIGFISGGSPCQGFSRLTKSVDQKTMKQWKNRSLVASFASFVDHYRPQYGLLENVAAMIQTGDKRDECHFSQLVCCIVGLGYQVRVIYADAWSYGAPQARSRVFLSFAALGVRMPKAPQPTHSHPPGTKIGTLGKMSNEQPFGERIHAPTPFDFISARAATRDLPDIKDGKVDICVSFPDHRVPIGVTTRTRIQLRHIPMHPYGMGYDHARYGYYENGRHVPGSITDKIRDNFFPKPHEYRLQPGTNGWRRVHPNGLFRTVVTACGPTDRLVGQVNHWDQLRPLTVMEARRAQGFLDHEVITGTPRERWYIIGNSVARQVALALGLAIREAWFGTLFEDASEIECDETIENLPEIMESSTETRTSMEQDTSDGAGPLRRSRREILSDVNEDPCSTPATSIDEPIPRHTIVVELGSRRRHKEEVFSGWEVAKRMRFDSDSA